MFTAIACIICSLFAIIGPFFYAQLLCNAGAKRNGKRKKSLWWIIKTTFTLDVDKIDFD